jgi:hypothetical protein
MMQNSAAECRRLSYYSYYQKPPELAELDLTANSSYTEGDETMNSNPNSHDGDDDSDEMMRVASPICHDHEYRLDSQQERQLESLSPIKKSPWAEDDHAPARFIYTSSHPDCLSASACSRRTSFLSSSIISFASTSKSSMNHRPASKLRLACRAGVLLLFLLYVKNVMPHLRKTGNAFVHVRIWNYHLGFFTSVWKEDNLHPYHNADNNTRSRWLPVHVSFHENEDEMWHHIDGPEEEEEEEDEEDEYIYIVDESGEL